jgi:hypothetical protein
MIRCLIQRPRLSGGETTSEMSDLQQLFILVRNNPNLLKQVIEFAKKNLQPNADSSGTLFSQGHPPGDSSEETREVADMSLHSSAAAFGLGSIKISLICRSWKGLFLLAAAVASPGVQEHIESVHIRFESVLSAVWESTPLLVSDTASGYSEMIKVSPDFETPCNICGDTVAGAAQTLFLSFTEVHSDAFQCFAGFKKGCRCIGQYLVCFRCGARSKCKNTATLISTLENHVEASGEHRLIFEGSEER